MSVDFRSTGKFFKVDSKDIFSTTKSGNQTTVKSSGWAAGWSRGYRQQVFEDVTTPTYSTTVSTTGGERKITNLDLQSTWGQPIALLWGHTRVGTLPIWANQPLEASGAEGSDIPAPRRPFVDFDPNEPAPSFLSGFLGG